MLLTSVAVDLIYVELISRFRSNIYCLLDLHIFSFIQFQILVHKHTLKSLNVKPRVRLNILYPLKMFRFNYMNIAGSNENVVEADIYIHALVQLNISLRVRRRKSKSRYVRIAKRV